MPFPNFVHLTNASPGAPRNSGTNGDLNALIWWALQQVGWSREYHDGATNASIFRPAVGNRFRLYVRHDSSVSGDARKALVRGCENASSANTLIDPFPLASQVADANSNWLISNTASTADREFHIIAWDSGVIYLSKTTGTANRWQMGFFGDVSEADAPDTWGTVIYCRESASIAATSVPGSPILTLSNSGLFFSRDISGTVKSSRGVMFSNSGSFANNTGNLPNMDTGYLGEIRMDRAAISCGGTGTTSTGANALQRRGFFPQLWYALANNRGSISENDTWTNSAYAAGSQFKLLPYLNDTQLPVFELSNTWSPPNG